MKHDDEPIIHQESELLEDIKRWRPAPHGPVASEEYSTFEVRPEDFSTENEFREWMEKQTRRVEDTVYPTDTPVSLEVEAVVNESLQNRPMPEGNIDEDAIAVTVAGSVEKAEYIMNGPAMEDTETPSEPPTEE